MTMVRRHLRIAADTQVLLILKRRTPNEADQARLIVSDESVIISNDEDATIMVDGKGQQCLLRMHSIFIQRFIHFYFDDIQSAFGNHEVYLFCIETIGNITPI